MELSLIIPAYNEENRIENTLIKYSKFLQHQEIIVVCDGNDSTSNIVVRMSEKNSNVKLLSFKKRLGKGGAIIEGFKVAEADRIGFIDADGPIEPNDFKKMLEALSYADGVIASRRLDESKIIVKQPLKRRIGSRVFNALIKVIFGLNFKDTQCGAKVFRKEAIKGILDDFKTHGFEFDVELLWRLKGSGYKIIEFPIEWEHVEGSSFNLFEAPRMLFSLFMLRLGK
jgi:glycosyltransferase involved in cell wall biosynthesis